MLYKLLYGYTAKKLGPLYIKVAALAAAAARIHHKMRASILFLAAVTANVDLQCQIFDETMVCDNEKGRLKRAEIRTCSG